MANTVTVDAIKMCRDCRTVQSLNSFRKRSRHGETRMHQCNACHWRREQARRCKHHADETRESVVDGARAIVQARSTYQREAALAAAIQHVDGPEEFGKLLVDGYKYFRKSGENRQAFWLMRAMFTLSAESAVSHRELLSDSLNDH